MSEQDKKEGGDTPLAVKNCTVCKKPVKGHLGPHGPGKCMDTYNENSDNTEQVDEAAAAISDPGIKDVLKAMVSEMANLSVGIQAIVAGQTALCNKLDGHVTARQPSHASVGSTSTRPTTPSQHGQPHVMSGMGSPGVAGRLASLHTLHQPAPQPQPGLIPPHYEPTHPILQDLATNRLPNGAVISNKTKNAAISGEFVNLSEFLPSTESHTDYETTIDPLQGSLQVKPKRCKKLISSFLTWLEAWNAFEELILQYHPSVYKQCHDYRSFIQKCDKKYHWYAVSAFDTRFRALLGQSKSYNFGNIDSDLYVTTLDATVIKQVPRCFRCRSPEHEVQECPFPEVARKTGTAAMAAATTAPKPRYDSPTYQGREVCINFNNKRCRFPNCRRAHVCSGCRGSTPRVDCSTCNTGRTHPATNPASVQAFNPGPNTGYNPVNIAGIQAQLLGQGMGSIPTT